MAQSHFSWKRKEPFQLIKEIQNYSSEPNTLFPGQNKISYHTLPLKEAIAWVQEQLKDTEGKGTDKAAHNQLLHQAVIGYPKAQEKVKAMISQWLLDHRLRVIEIIPGMSDVDTLFAEALGLSVIEDLYKSKQYEEIEVVGTKVFSMVGGKKRLIPYRKFRDVQHVLNIQQRLVLYGHARLSEQEPFCHTYLYDGSRLTMKMPPFSAEPSITIRRFNVQDVTLKGFIGLGTMDEKVGKLLRLLMLGKTNGIIAGDTGTGKTTLLYALIGLISPDERIITLESEFELRIHERFPDRNVISLQEVEDIGLTLAKAFPTTLRDTPDRIFIGEVRSNEIVEAFKATSRGHRGSWFTFHLSDPSHLKFALYTLYLEAGLQLPLNAFEIQLGLSVNILIFLRYLNDGRRVIANVSELYLSSEGQLVISPLVQYYRGEWEWSGNRLSERLLDSMLQTGEVTMEEIRSLGLTER